LYDGRAFGKGLIGKLQKKKTAPRERLPEKDAPHSTPISIFVNREIAAISVNLGVFASIGFKILSLGATFQAA
jgi:hypothetical protein